MAQLRPPHTGSCQQSASERPSSQGEASVTMDGDTLPGLAVVVISKHTRTSSHCAVFLTLIRSMSITLQEVRRRETKSGRGRKAQKTTGSEGPEKEFNKAYIDDFFQRYFLGKTVFKTTLEPKPQVGRRGGSTGGGRPGVSGVMAKSRAPLPRTQLRGFSCALFFLFLFQMYLIYTKEHMWGCKCSLQGE